MTANVTTALQVNATEADIKEACERFNLSLETWTRQEHAFGLLKKVYARRRSFAESNHLSRPTSFPGTGDNNIDIGYNVGGVKGESNTIRIGNTDITATHISGISGQTVVGGAAVFVDSSGKLGTMTASTRFTDEIKPMDKASEAILTLKPVTFRYKQEIDPKSIRQFGLIAEEVEKVNPDLVGRDEQGKVYSVRYDAVNAMLLNEFLKEHGKVEKLETTVARQQKQIEVLTAGLQKVTAQLEVRRPAPRNVDDIMAASFGVRQSERILVRSCEAGRDLSATTVAVNLRSK